MSLSNHLKYLKDKAKLKSEKGIKSQGQTHFKKELKRELQLKPNESIAEKFPENYDQLYSVVLARLPKEDPNRKKMASATARYMMGDAAAKVENQIGVNYSKIHQIMGIVFPDPKEMISVLETTLLNNAVLANAVFMSKAHDLTPKDAAIASGIFAQRFLELKKDREGTDTPPVDFKLVVQLQATLADLNTIKQIPGKVIDT